MLVTVWSFPADEFPSDPVFDIEAVSGIRFERWLRKAGNLVRYLWVSRSRADSVDGAARDDGVGPLEVVLDRDREVLVRTDMASSGKSILDVPIDAGGTILMAPRDSNTWTITLRFDDHDRLDDCYRSCREHGFTSTVGTSVPESGHPNHASSRDGRSRVESPPVTDAEEFETSVEILFRPAHDAGVTPSDEWRIQNGSDAGEPDWEVSIGRVAVPDGGQVDSGSRESVVVDLSIPTGAFELGEILRPPPPLEIELVEFVPVDDGVVPYIWVTNQTPVFGEYVRKVRSDERVNEFRFVHAEEGRRLVRFDWEREPDGFLDACLATDAIVEHGRGTHDRWTFQLRFLKHGDLTRFHRLCTDADVPLDIHRVTSPGREDPAYQYGLTDPQHDALLLARERGYFDTPREVTLEELGEELDITRQAVAYRLRDGIRQLVDEALRTPNFDD